MKKEEKDLLDEFKKKLIHTNFSEITEHLKAGVSPNLFSVTNRTDLVLESIVRKKLYMLERALDYGFRLSDEFYYLHHAIRTNDLKFVKLIDQEYQKLGKNQNEIDADGNNVWHILMDAKDQPTDAIVNYVKSIGAKLDHKNKQGKTPINNLLRSALIVPDFLIVMIKENKSILDLKDAFDVSPRDILNSCKYSKDWIQQEKNRQLISLLD